MRYRIAIPLAGLLLLAGLAPARAEGRWTLGLLAGESISQNHGAALDARAFAQVDPRLGLGIETGVACMNEETVPQVFAVPVEPDGGAAIGLASLSDGITRNRGYYLGPAVRVGQAVYAVASTGLYEFSDNEGNALGTRWGYSAGLGLAGRGHFAPSAELRYRLAPDGPRNASAVIFAVGLQIQ